MSESDGTITPSTKVADLLAAYPELEDVLIEMAPPFRKLRNPLLRRSVAKVASLSQAAAVARLPVSEFVNKLRVAVGQVPTMDEPDSENTYFTARPRWVDRGRIAVTIDERIMSTETEMPLKRMMQKAVCLEEGDVLELVTTFLPAPGIDVMKAKGFRVWPMEAEPGVIRTYVSRQPGRKPRASIVGTEKLPDPEQST